MKNETQESVSAWIDESYPGASMERRIKHAFEELTELAVKAVPDINVEKLQAIVAHTAEKALNQDDDGRGIAGEVGDMRISLTGIATAAGVNEQQALNDVMGQNRARPFQDRQRREADKQKLEIFQP